MNNIKGGKARAVVVNSGNANACIGNEGYKDAVRITELAASELGCDPSEILINSTGVIGIKLDMRKVEAGVKLACKSISNQGGLDAQHAIMTTDLVEKISTVELELDGKKVHIGGMAKGSGMIHPNMATMIGILTTDAAISHEMLQKALSNCVNKTFNRVSVDGDTSVCDMVVILANGLAKNAEIVSQDQFFDKFVAALSKVCVSLSKKIAGDGEGATKLVEINALNVKTQEDAYKIVTAIAKSPLVKTAIFGQDANWGRILTAAGYSGAEFDPDKVDIYIGNIKVCENGCAYPFSEDEALKVLKNKEILITLDFNDGEFDDRMWTCDFSYDYVKINGSYRS